MHARTVRALFFLLVLTLAAAAQIHPSLPEPGTLDGLGVNIHFTQPLPGELEMIRAAGFRWVRMDFTWAATEPEAGRYDFSKYDSLLAALEKAGLRAYFILDYGHPRFGQQAAVGKTDSDLIRKAGRQENAAGNSLPDFPPSLEKHPFTSHAGTQEFRDAFAKWAVAAVGRFKGRGIVWELWNEPNIAGFWKPKPDVQQYIALAKTVAAALENAGLRGKSRTFPPGTKREAAGECLTGPATSLVDLPFLDACFAAGLLDVFDAISVHPYRQGAPESVAEEYRALRLLIRRHCAADALPLGTFDPSRPDPKRRIPILSGEWGWSAAWPSLGKDEAAREATQAKYLPRMFLTNIANDIPLSIWYDWRDDGDDAKEAEHRFGIVRRKPTGDAKQPFEPKPGYTAMKVMSEELKGMRFSKNLQVIDRRGWMHLFADEKKQALALWIDEALWHDQLYFGNYFRYVGTFKFRDIAGGLSEFNSNGEHIKREMKNLPYFIQSESQPLLLRVLATQIPMPLEIYSSPKTPFEISMQWKNPTAHPIEVGSEFLVRNRNVHPQCLFMENPKMELLAAGSSGEKKLLVQPCDGRDGWCVSEEIVVRGQGRDSEHSSIDIPIVFNNSLSVQMLPSSQKRINVLLLNRSGEPRSGVLEAVMAVTMLRSKAAMGDPSFPVPKTKFTLAAGQRSKAFTIVAKDSETPDALHRKFANAATGPKSILDPQYRWAGVTVRDSVGGDTGGGGILISMPSFSRAGVTLHSDGDAAIASTQSLADAQPAEGASISGTPSVRLSYEFADGWKFVRIEPKDAAARKIEGEPREFGLWVHGDGNGGVPCIRLRDATGQTHQVRGEAITWKGWRYLTFPLRPAPDDGRTMIPLPDAGAEQRVSWGHWGGANDGEVHYPLGWDALFLLDGNRRALKGEIFLSAPTLVY